ncbi:MAG: GNAT family N-acetyltransferase [Acetobacteraceae bacterium]|nr:GNAT family N-acetyltransferase [Acetobacteraceae bacterium]
MLAPPPLSHLVRQHFGIRELHASEGQACRIFFSHLELADIRMRFGSLHFSIRYFLPGQPGTGSGVAFAAMDATDQVLGIVNLAYLTPGAAEMAVIVRSDYKRRGIGHSLLAHAIYWAESQGLSEVVGYVFADNKPMLSLAHRMGLHIVRWDGLDVEIRKCIPPKQH